ncbi:MAG: hypothetical protein ACRDTA_25985 [Pseudonocardiaceae bacterium]
MACTTLHGHPVAVTTSDDNTVRVWDLTTATLRTTLTGHDNSVTAVACPTLDDQPLAVTASKDKTVRVWDLTTTTELAVFDYVGHVGALCIGPAQEIVIGTGWDLTVIDRRPSR